MNRLSGPLGGTTLARVALSIALVSAPRPAAADAEQAPTPRAPHAWGIVTHSKGCVIFREYRKTKVGFWVVVVTTKTHSELEVVETDGYELDQKIWIEDEATMEELQRRAIRDGIRYVKIPDKYTPEELEAARTLCRKDNLAE
jgi:hypothetical protein